MRNQTTTRDKPVILVVDDHERNIQVVGTTLVAAGYEIIPALSGEQALQRLEAASPDLILLDILLPDIDGFEVCRRLQANPDTAEIPIIFLSAADEQDVIVRALEAGGVDYVTKPFNKAELLIRVRTHVELKDARDRLQELVQMREEFIGILAHDLKNPLTGMRFSAQLLMEKSDELPEKLQKLAGSILDGANHMFEFIDQFLADKARKNASLSVELKPINPIEICQTVVARHETPATQKRISLELQSPEEPLAAKGDSSALGQVIDNLLSNAIKFSSSGKRICVRVHAADEDHVSIDVEDEGPGFTKADQQKVFQRFVRLSAKPTGGETSTGLGLSIVKRLVSMMGGEISLKSAKGQGATFRVQLKRA